MDPVWLAIFLLLAIVAAVQSVLVLIQTWEHRRYARNRLRLMYHHRPKGRVMLYAPCKGMDIDLWENLGRLLAQDHDNYEVTFIVESESDPAYWLIRRLTAEHPNIPTRIVVAGLAASGGQKIHNLREATKEIPPDVEYLAFVDSDAGPRRQWLRSLISLLETPGVGAVSGYRWFIPVRRSLATYLIYAVNCGVAVLFRSRDPNLIWGGSWAVRRDVFEEFGVRDELTGKLTEDLVVANLIRRNGLRVEYEPACMTASPIDGTLVQLFAFLRRQYMLARFYAPKHWAVGLVGTIVSNAATVASLGLLAWGLATGTAVAWGTAAASLSVLYALHVVRGVIRQGLVRVYLPDRQRELRLPALFDIWAGPLVSFFSVVGLIASAIGRTVTWRGITYRVLRDGTTTIVRRVDDRPATAPQPTPLRKAS